MKILTAFAKSAIPMIKCNWTAYENSYEPGDPIGRGITEDDAIADLLSQIRDKDEDYFCESPGNTL